MNLMLYNNYLCYYWQKRIIIVQHYESQTETAKTARSRQGT